MVSGAGLGKHVALWLDSAPATDYPSLAGDRRFDVAVIGAGITGLTTALLLARAGLSVGLIEMSRIGSGVTGHSTAKVTSQHGLTYARLRITHGKDGARGYAEANEAAKERVAAFVDEGIDCDFRRRAAYVYASRRRERLFLERETVAAQDAGLPASFVETTPLPYPVRGAMRFENQAELHPQHYLLGLARLLEQAGGQIFERTRAARVEEGSPCRIETECGALLTEQVVIATLMPFADRGGFFARAFPSRSYVISARIAGPAPDGMFISAGAPLRSVRAQPYDGGELLLVGGESHHVGSSKAEPARYRALAEFTREHWDVRSIEHRWSAQDYIPDDGVPYIGRLHMRSRSVYIATGLKKWGMTNGTLAGMLISDAILARESPWAKLFSSTRVKPLAEAPKLVFENARVGAHFFADRLIERGTRPIGELAPGEGAIVESAGQKVAGYRDEDGGLHAVSARCTHLYCQVKWNAAERSWDCPCHGSRFTVDGDVLNGPAVKPLDPRPLA